MKTLARPLFALALVSTLALPSRALFGWGEKPAESGPLGAVLTEVAGTVTLKRASGGDYAPAASQTPIETNDTIKVGKDGRAVLMFLDGSKMELRSESVFAVLAHTPKKVEVKIDVGTLKFWIKKVAQRRSYKMRTPTAVASVRGTEGQLDVSPDGDTTLKLTEGRVDFADNRGNNVTVNANEQITSTDDKGLEGAAKTSLEGSTGGTETETDEAKKEETEEGGEGDTLTNFKSDSSNNPAQTQAVSNSTP
ncbi:MAG: FecR domain-containing protein [Elusimicrobia bacterium]|nr:FecR domain-containing protein [Elusimicrobiota bacterium]